MSRLGPDPFILTINGGSSSLKFALFRDECPPVRVAQGMIDRIGLPDGVMTAIDLLTGESEQHALSSPDHAATVGLLVELMERHVGNEKLRAIGHRVVHGGMRYSRPERYTGSCADDRTAEAHPVGSMAASFLVAHCTGRRRRSRGARSLITP